MQSCHFFVAALPHQQIIELQKWCANYAYPVLNGELEGGSIMAAGRSPHGSGDQASAWLATVFTLAGGLLACVFLVISSGESPGKPMLVALGVISALLFILWLLREKPPEAQQQSLKIWLWWKKEDAESYEYQPRPRKRSSHVNYGQNQPPTLESIRETVDERRTWVPSVRNSENTTDDSNESQIESSSDDATT